MSFNIYNILNMCNLVFLWLEAPIKLFGLVGAVIPLGEKGHWLSYRVKALFVEQPLDLPKSDK